MLLGAPSGYARLRAVSVDAGASAVADGPLRGISLELLAGEVTALVGVAGAGARTLLAVVEFRVTPSAGTLLVNEFAAVSFGLPHIWATDDPTAAAAADRVLVMLGGRVVADLRGPSAGVIVRALEAAAVVDAERI